jgi:hypothetical protein
MLTIARKGLTAAGCLALVLTAGACGSNAENEISTQPANDNGLATSTAGSSASAGNAQTDAQRCADALPLLADYNATEVLFCEGGSADEVRAWLNDRPESGGATPDRGIDGLDADQRVVVAVVRGDFPIPRPPSPDGRPAPAADGGRFLILPGGETVFDGAARLETLLSLTPKFGG